jgi:hypothetical protein
LIGQLKGVQITFRNEPRLATIDQSTPGWTYHLTFDIKIMGLSLQRITATPVIIAGGWWGSVQIKLPEDLDAEPVSLMVIDVLLAETSAEVAGEYDFFVESDPWSTLSPST